MTTTTPHTLSELADIGAKAALDYLNVHLGVSNVIIIHPEHSLYNKDAPGREAFVRAVLDAVGYKLPVDHEREAFDKWAKETNTPESEFIFAAFKAGRAMLRESMEKQPEKSDIKDYIFHYQSDRDLAKSVPLEAQQPETFEAHGHTWTKHTPGDPCPVAKGTMVACLLERDLSGEVDVKNISQSERAEKWHWGKFPGSPKSEVAAYRLVSKPENDGWIPWSGGECPVDGGLLIEVKYRGYAEIEINRGKEFRWNHADKPSDIIAYKIITTAAK